LSDDWIPVPEIENVLIVMARLAEDPAEIEQAPVMPLLQNLKSWTNGSVYVFHDPPEAGEVLEDVDAGMAAKFALAAQMSDDLVEACRDAFRRVFSRATVQRVVLVSANDAGMDLSQIDQVFGLLDQAEIVWMGEWPARFILAMRSWHEEIFSDLELAGTDLRKRIEAIAAARGLKFLALDDAS